jgi:hypothetical protein
MFEDHSAFAGARQAYTQEHLALAIDQAIETENQLRHQRRKRINAKDLLRTNTRLKTIRQLVCGRYNGPCPPEHAATAELYLDAVLPLLSWKAKRLNRHDYATCPMAWAQQWTPTLIERGPEWFEGRTRAAVRRWLTDDELGEMLAVEAWEIEAYGLRLIGAADKTEAQRREEKKAAKRHRDRDRIRQKRAAAGISTPRPRSLSVTRPWEAMGICRRTWERRRAAGTLP